jgi:hypothetical protein
MLTNQFAQLGPSSQRSIEMIGGNHPSPSGTLPKNNEYRAANETIRAKPEWIPSPLD